MKLNFDERAGAYAISAYADGWVRVGERRIDVPCVVTPTGVHTDLLPARLDLLGPSEFERLLALAPEIVLLGTGARQHFVDFAFTRLLAAHGVGLEVMTTGAACRSYNVLLAEDRVVIAALFMH